MGRKNSEGSWTLVPMTSEAQTHSAFLVNSMSQHFYLLWGALSLELDICPLRLKLPNTRRTIYCGKGLADVEKC